MKKHAADPAARWAIADALNAKPSMLAGTLNYAPKQIVQAADLIETKLPADKSLAIRLRSVSEAVAFAGDLIAGKVKPRRLRKGQPSGITNDDIVRTVFYISFFRPNWLRKQFIPDVAKAFKVSTKHVYNVLAEYKNDPVAFDHPNKIAERILARK
jgi:hypothetical protein